MVNVPEGGIDIDFVHLMLIEIFECAMLEKNRVFPLVGEVIEKSTKRIFRYITFGKISLHHNMECMLRISVCDSSKLPNLANALALLTCF